jgi:hypothetical protein
MSRLFKAVLCSALFVTVSGAGFADDAPAAPASVPTIAEEYASVVVGSFTSAEQSSMSEGYGTVENETRRIWPERTDGVWLYSENAWMGDTPSEVDPSAKDTPYFQSITRIYPAGPGMVLTEAYGVADRGAAKGGWRNPEAFKPEWLGEKNCSGQLERVAHGYWMGAFSCINTFRGASYLRSKRVRTPDSYANWDAGIAADGSHVWGPARAGYIFKRVGNE